MSRTQHPPWCSSIRCQAGNAGPHRSEPVPVATAGKSPRFLLSLFAPRRGRTQMQIVMISDLLISDAKVGLDDAHLLAVTLTKLIEQARPFG